MSDYWARNADLGQFLHDIWCQQVEYNKSIRAYSHISDTKVYWTKQYLLGLVSEVDEVLREISWKEHRSPIGDVIPDNLAIELADLTKYILSLWELWGYDLDDLLNYTWEKSKWVAVRSKMEMTQDPSNRLVVLTDLDGTLADWRTTFIHWVKANKGISLPDDPSTSLLMDVDLAISYPEYSQWKEEFEATGGYGNLVAYFDGILAVRRLAKEYGAFIIVYTARPEHKYKRIWWDTYQWLSKRCLHPDKLYIGAEPRVLLADRLRTHNKVILLDDNPDLITRASQAGVRVIGRRHPYNAHLSNSPNVRLVEQFGEIQLDEYFKGL